MCKEAGVAYLLMLPTIMQGQTEENHQNSQCFKAQLIFKPATCRIPDRRFNAWNVSLGATDLKVPRANNANDIGLLITDIIVLIITRMMVYVCYVCVWIPVRMNMDDRWPKGGVEYPDDYPVRMSVILQAMQHDCHSQLSWYESYINRTSRTDTGTIGLLSTWL